MLSIRFTRIGRKKAPLYRIVIMDKRRDPWGKYIEKLGFYNPRTKETQLDKERISYWLSQGAQCSATVHNLFIKNELIKGEKAKSVDITKTRALKINKAKEDKKASADAKALADKKEEESKKSEESVETPAPAEEISTSVETPADREKPVETPAPAEEVSTSVETAVDKKEETPVVEETKTEETPAEEKPAEEASKTE